MARVVETVAAQYADSVRWEIVVTKRLEGALRHAELSKKLGRPMPVPSIIVNGELAFESIPSVEDLRAYLDARI
ncbi:MAG: hypothetical protein C4519_02980 [Desulfobacteraceae bacterium]|nr:MAG: hypothetical protein C4519_02980 [Desulfobacteraceae bacterium]